jgi:hypothetical protein
MSCGCSNSRSPAPKDRIRVRPGGVCRSRLRSSLFWLGPQRRQRQQLPVAPANDRQTAPRPSPTRKTTGYLKPASGNRGRAASGRIVNRELRVAKLESAFHCFAVSLCPGGKLLSRLSGPHAGLDRLLRKRFNLRVLGFESPRARQTTCVRFDGIGRSGQARLRCRKGFEPCCWFGQSVDRRKNVGKNVDNYLGTAG